MATILLVEGHPEVRALLGAVVADLGHSCVDPPARLPAIPPVADVVVVDPSLPGAAGLVRAARRRSPRAAVVALPSGPSDEREPVEDAVATLSRPFSLDALSRALRRAVELATASPGGPDVGPSVA